MKSRNKVRREKANPEASEPSEAACNGSVRGSGAKRANPETSELLEAACNGDRRALGKLLTLVERGGADGDEVAQIAWPKTGDAHVVGVTGAPGVGKSTLVDRMSAAAIAEGRRVAILAVDPSSPLTGGAILGDRVRMDSALAATGGSPFIRSMASRGQSGGLALAALGAVRVLDAAGHDPIIVETVGTGQVEVDVVNAADTVVVAVSPGWGDAVQANKAGVLELANVFAVNKADRPGASDARRDLEHMLDLGTHPDWRPPIVETTATSGEGVKELWKHVCAHRRHLLETRSLQKRRAGRAAEEVRRYLHNRINGLISRPSPRVEKLIREVTEGLRPPREAAESILPEPGETLSEGVPEIPSREPA